MIVTAPAFAGGAKGSGFHSHATAVVRDHRSNAGTPYGSRQGGVAVYDLSKDPHRFHPPLYKQWGGDVTDHRGSGVPGNSEQWGGDVHDHR